MALRNMYKWISNKKQSSPVNPEKDCYKIGDKCNLCHNQIKPHISISICKCLKFCHKQCFIDNLSTQISGQVDQFRCEICKERINLEYDIFKVFRPKMEMNLGIQGLLALGLMIVGLVLVSWLFGQVKNTMTKLSNDKFILTIIGVAFVMIGVIWMVYILKKILWKKQVKIRSIKSSGLTQQISQFQLSVLKQQTPIIYCNLQETNQFDSIVL